ncbi:MAG: PucR family transcriptional regulator ligand-binding domain-containing protein, partial [Gaiellales bacterium]
MALTGRDLLELPGLELEVVVDGDLDRPVQWVHTTELADPSRYLQGDEVILTTGVWRAAGITSEQFVAPLARAGVAALGYGIPEPDAVVPPDLIDACRAAGLPLFAVPFEMPFIAVSRAFVED